MFYKIIKTYQSESGKIFNTGEDAELDTVHYRLKELNNAVITPRKDLDETLFTDINIDIMTDLLLKLYADGIIQHLVGQYNTREKALHDREVNKDTRGIGATFK